MGLYHGRCQQTFDPGVIVESFHFAKPRVNDVQKTWDGDLRFSNFGLKHCLYSPRQSLLEDDSQLVVRQGSVDRGYHQLSQFRT